MAWLGANYLTILNGFALASLLFIIAVGLSLVFGTLNVLNLAHGALALVGGYIGVSISSTAGSLSSAALALTATAGVTAGLGLLLAFMMRDMTDQLRQAVLTLGVALVIAEVMREIFGSNPQSVAPPDFLNGTVELGGTPYPIYRLSLVGIGALVAVALYWILERTRAGALVRASVADREMVEAMGVRTSILLGGVFAVGAALAGVGGLLAAPVLGVQPGLDNTVLLLALVVVVIGGLGSIRGALLGAILVGQVQSIGVVLLPEVSAFLLFAMMGVVLIVRPEGLLATRNSKGASLA